METPEKLAYLQAMGIQAWSLRLHPPGFEGGEGTNVSAIPGEDTDARVMLEESLHPPSEMRAKDGSILALEAGSLAGEIKAPMASARQTACGWDELKSKVEACTACPLHFSRTQTVFGVGDPQADWMVIGEAPGEQEDLQGEPFVGRAGLLLNEMLRAIGLEREQVFIANILKCRPPKNRDPQADEAAACEGFLQQQLKFINPRIILAVGRIAAQNLLKTTTPIGKLRGIVHDYQGVPLVVTYHPAYLLRSPLEKRRAYDDLRLARRAYRQTLSS